MFTDRLSWSGLQRLASLPVPEAGPEEAGLAGRLRHLLHLDEPERLAYYLAWLRGEAPRAQHGLAWRQMLAYALFHERQRTLDAATFEALLAAHPAVREDLIALFEVLLDQVGLSTLRAPEGHPWPLALHRTYNRREILTALGRWTPDAKPDSREGVLRLEEARVEVLFVTLNKAHDRFKPTTRYEDYALDARHFHWQSQSQTSPEAPAGRRYVEQATNGWRFLLFVRPTIEDAYTYLGPVRYVRHQGSRPMSIIWRLAVPMPGACLRECLQHAS